MAGSYTDHGAGHIKKQRRGKAMHIKAHKHDGMAHPSHHTANTDHGTPGGFAPADHYQDGGCDHHLGSNVAMED